MTDIDYSVYVGYEVTTNIASSWEAIDGSNMEIPAGTTCKLISWRPLEPDEFVPFEGDQGMFQISCASAPMPEDLRPAYPYWLNMPSPLVMLAEVAE